MVVVDVIVALVDVGGDNGFVVVVDDDDDDVFTYIDTTTAATAAVDVNRDRYSAENLTKRKPYA